MKNSYAQREHRSPEKLQPKSWCELKLPTRTAKRSESHGLSLEGGDDK